MNLISKEWIQKAIRPSDSKTCGNHVAGRKFSAKENKYQVRDLTGILISYISYMTHLSPTGVIYSFKSLITLKQPSPNKRGRQIHLFNKSVKCVCLNF